MTWKNGANAAAFAEAALNYAKTNDIAAVKTADAGTDGKAEFTGLDLGYYLVNSTLGAICSLDTTNPNATIDEKNEEPSITKTEDVTTQTVGKVVNYTVKVNVKEGAENYVVHDVMSTGLTFNDDVKVTLDGNEVAAENYDVIYPATDAHTFDVAFKDSYLKNLAGKELVITYSATVNKDGIGVSTNKAKLTYGEDNSTEFIVVEVTNYSFDLVKTNTDSKVISGAKFKLYDAKTGGNEIKLVKEGDYYRPAVAGETGVEIEAGSATIKGLANGTYFLEETQAPKGYNKLAERVEVTINSADNKATISSDNVLTNGGVQVINQTGTELPSTGGVGTTMFYVIGAILMLGAAVVLITKKKVSANKD